MDVTKIHSFGHFLQHKNSLKNLYHIAIELSRNQAQQEQKQKPLMNETANLNSNGV